MYSLLILNTLNRLATFSIIASAMYWIINPSNEASLELSILNYILAFLAYAGTIYYEFNLYKEINHVVRINKKTNYEEKEKAFINLLKVSYLFLSYWLCHSFYSRINIYILTILNIILFSLIIYHLFFLRRQINKTNLDNEALNYQTNQENIIKAFNIIRTFKDKDFYYYDKYLSFIAKCINEGYLDIIKKEIKLLILNPNTLLAGQYICLVLDLELDLSKEEYLSTNFFKLNNEKFLTYNLMLQYLLDIGDNDLTKSVWKELNEYEDFIKTKKINEKGSVNDFLRLCGTIDLICGLKENTSNKNKLVKV